jgi:hypothetical protein
MSRATASFPSRWRYVFVRAEHGLKVDGLNATSVAVGLVLSEFADWTTGGNVRPGHKMIARAIGTTLAPVKKSISALVSSGWLTIDDRGSFGRATTYRLVIPPLVSLTTGEITPPVTGSNLTPWEKPGEDRNGVVSACVTGSNLTPQLCQELRPARGLRVVAA